MTLRVWIDPSDADTVTLSGSRVTDITDKSSSGNDVTESASSGPNIAAAAVNGLDVLDPATGDYLQRVNGSLNNISGGPGHTMVAAVMDDGGTSTFGGIMSMTNSGLGNGWRLLRFTGTYQWSNQVQTPRVYGPIASPANPDSPVIISCQNVDAVYQWIAVDGVFADSIQQLNVVSYSEDLRLITNAGSFAYLNGYMCEFLYFDDDITTDQIQRAEGYLAFKWGSQDRLPAAHPFKIFPPDIVQASELIATFEGDDGDTSYTSIDATGRTVTFVGTADIDRSVSKFGTTSLFLDGNSDYVTIPNSADFDFGSGDFTIELWLRFAVDPGTGNVTFIGKWDDSGNNRSWVLALTNNRLRLNYSDDGVANSQWFDDIGSPQWNPVVDTWYHLACVRLGDAISFFVDGVRQGPALTTSPAGLSFYAATSTLDIGAVNEGAYSQFFNGNIDSVRVTKGTALYHHNFDVPHRAFRDTVPATLLANFNATDGTASPPGYTSEDANARSGTFAANAQLDTGSPISLSKYGFTSLLLDGTGDYLSFPTSVDFDFGAGDFTVEFWMKPNATGTANIISWGNATQGAIYYDGTGTDIHFQTGGVLRIGGGTTATGTWYHVALERLDDTFILYLDGVALGSYNGAVTFDQAAFEIGRRNGSSNMFNGNIDSVRVIKGTALRGSVQAQGYLFNPVEDFSQLLLNFEGTHLDTFYTPDNIVQSPTVGAITFLNGAQISNVERAIGTTSLDVIAEADSITIPTGSGLALGTGDFTIEFRVLFTSAPSAVFHNACIDHRQSGAAEARPWIGTANTGKWSYFVAGADRITDAAGAIPTTGKWYHVVVERVAGVTRMFVDGSQVGSDYTDATNYLDGTLTIGSRWDQGASSNSMEGYLDMVRISVGTAIYRGDFDVPIAAPGEPIV